MLTILEFGVWLLGLCVGSFLNVVVYRLPLGLSIARPTWSFCPHCNHPLRSRDNVPLLGWLILRGRCRDCSAPISAQYPFVEALTGLVFVLVFHWIFVGIAWPVAADAAWPRDLPLALAWLTLAACLVACAAMDIVSYLIDTGVTLFAMVVGIASFTFWTPAATATFEISRPALAAALAAGIVCVPMLAWIFLRAPHLEPGAAGGSDAAGEDGPAAAATQSETSPDASTPGIEPHPTADEVGSDSPRRPLPFALVALAILAFALPALGLIVAAAHTEAYDLRAGVDSSAQNLAGIIAFWCSLAGLIAIFGLMVLSAGQPREADERLAEEIEDEAPAARRTSLFELLWLSPIVIAALAAWLAVAYLPAAAAFLDTLLNWSPAGGIRPVAGAAFAVHGAIAAAAAGWGVRLVFTIVFGREAFGVGDIYILAAAGACAGWAVALLGFLLSVGVALLAWLASLTAKRSAMIAFGPPLAIGFLLALWLYRPLAGFFARVAEEYEPLWRSSPLMLIGFFVLASVFAVLVSRMLRRLIEPGDNSADDPPEALNR